MPTKHLLFACFLLILCSAASCDKSSMKDDLKLEQQYIFLGHTYDWHANGEKVDPRLEKIDYSSFDQIWLGGDICSETSRNPETLIYLDGLFDLDDNNTHWSIGNHDARNGNIDKIQEATGRPLFYTTHRLGITYLILNTVAAGMAIFEEDRCDILESQNNLVKSVLDTIQNSSHLVLITHYVHWNGIENDMPKTRFANAPKGYLPISCEGQKDFRNLWYFDLIDVQKRGVQVVMISGDGGQYSKGFIYNSPDNITFICSGINNSLDTTRCPSCDLGFNWNPDSVLIFDHDIKSRTLNYRFENLNELIGP